MSAIFIIVHYRCDMLMEATGASHDKCINGDLMEHLKLHLSATLHSQMPPAFTQLLQNFYAAAFKVFYHSQIGPQGKVMFD